jgi:hypothetical protein
MFDKCGLGRSMNGAVVENEKVRRKAMTRNQVHSIFLSAFVLVDALIAIPPAAEQDPKQPYPTMAPVEQYLMDRDAEIALAAAPLQTPSPATPRSSS